MPLMYKITRENGSYHAVEVDIYQGVKEVPVSEIAYKYPSIRIEQKAIGFTYEATLNPKTMEMSGTWKQGKRFRTVHHETERHPGSVSRTAGRKRLRVAEGFGPAGLLERNIEGWKYTAAGGPSKLPNGRMAPFGRRGTARTRDRKTSKPRPSPTIGPQ